MPMSMSKLSTTASCVTNMWHKALVKKYECNVNDETRYQCIKEFIESAKHFVKFGLVRPISEEKEDDYFPVTTVILPRLARGKDDKDKHFKTLLMLSGEDLVAENNEKAASALKERESRKKYAIIQFEDKIYIIGVWRTTLIGGYLYEPNWRERKSPEHEYCYDIATGQLTPIAKMPIPRTNFAVATDGSNIIVIGGQTFENDPLRSCLSYDMASNKWTTLEPLPAPVSGPGIYQDSQFVHVLGGYDIISGEVDVVGDYLLYNFYNNRWSSLAPISRKRARPLLVMPEINNVKYLYSIGGVTIDKTQNKAVPVAEIQRYDPGTQSWSLVTTIPNLKPSHVTAYDDGIISVIEREVDKETKEVTNMKVLHSFDVETSTWHPGAYSRKEKPEETPEPAPLPPQPLPTKKPKEEEETTCCNRKKKSKKKGKDQLPRDKARPTKSKTSKSATKSRSRTNVSPKTKSRSKTNVSAAKKTKSKTAASSKGSGSENTATSGSTKSAKKRAADKKKSKARKKSPTDKSATSAGSGSSGKGKTKKSKKPQKDKKGGKSKAKSSSKNQNAISYNADRHKMVFPFYLETGRPGISSVLRHCILQIPLDNGNKLQVLGNACEATAYARRKKRTSSTSTPMLEFSRRNIRLLSNDVYDSTRVPSSVSTMSIF